MNQILFKDVGPRRSWVAAILFCVFLVALHAGCGSNAKPSTSNEVLVGALLPFSGANAASGANIEEAMLQAVDLVNAHGGVGGRPMKILVRDTRSDAALGRDFALDLLNNHKVKYLIGPQEDQLALNIANDVTAADAVNLLPAVESPSIFSPTGHGLWYRLATPPQFLACGLALYLQTTNVTKVDIVSTDGNYNSQLASYMTQHIVRNNIKLESTVTLQSGQVSYTNQLDALGSDSDIVLITDPFTASTVVQDLLTTRTSLHLAMGPSLKSRFFLQNVPASALENQVGAAPSLVANDGTAAFASDFAARWGSDRPTHDAFAFFDAVILLALALNHATATDAVLPDSNSFGTHMLAVTDIGLPAPATWLSYGDMVSTLRRGGHVQYEGVTGPFAFDAFHNAVPTPVQIWAVQGRGFKDNLTLVECTPAAACPSCVAETSH